MSRTAPEPEFYPALRSAYGERMKNVVLLTGTTSDIFWSEEAGKYLPGPTAFSFGENAGSRQFIDRSQRAGQPLRSFTTLQLDEGATLIDPESVWFAYDTRLGRDVTVEPHVVFGPGVEIADGATNLLAVGNNLAGAVRPFNRATTGRVAFGSNLTPGGPLADAMSGLDATLSGSGQWRPLQLSDGEVASTTLRISSAEPGDGVVCSHDQLGSRPLLLTCHVESSGVIRAVLLNRSGGPVVVAAGTLRALVVRRSGP